MNYDVLMTELLAGHPVTGGYDVDNEVAAGQLNAINCTQNVESVSGQEIFEAVNQADFIALSAGHKSLLYAIIGMGTILVNGTNTKAALLAMFGAGTPTRANLAALQKQDVSRAVELGLGEVLPGNVEEVRR